MFFVVFGAGAFAQMSDEQVVNLLQNARNKGMGQEEMLLMLTQKGVTKEQLLRIKEKYTQSKNKQGAAETFTERMRVKENNVEPQKKTDELKEDKSEMVWLDSLDMSDEIEVQKVEKEKEIFGRNIFNNRLLTFEPNLNMATPENYVLGYLGGCRTKFQTADLPGWDGNGF